MKRPPLSLLLPAMPIAGGADEKIRFRSVSLYTTIPNRSLAEYCNNKLPVVSVLV